MLGELGSKGSHGRSSLCCTLPQPSENSAPPLGRHGHRQELWCISQQRSSCPVPHSSGRDCSLGHTVHSHASLGSLPMKVQSPNVTGLVGLGKINHPCYKSSYLCVRRAIWTLNEESWGLVVFPQIRDHTALPPDTIPRHSLTVMGWNWYIQFLKAILLQ